MSKEILSSRLIRLLEGVRIAEQMTIVDFVKHFEISVQAYHKWKRSVKTGGKIVAPFLPNVERGLSSLGYDAFIIITKSEK